MSKDWSRHTRYSDRKTPHGRRGLRVYGEREDFNRFFRCPYCNFLIDANEASSPGGPGVPPFLVNLEGPFDIGLPWTDVGDSTLGTIEADGDLAAIVPGYFPQVTGGCPFCGASNWK